METMGDGNGAARSYLAFDVDAAKGGLLQAFEEIQGLACRESDVIVFALDERLGTVIAEKTNALARTDVWVVAIVFVAAIKGKLARQEANADVRFVPAPR